MSTNYMYLHCPRGRWRGRVTAPGGKQYYSHSFDNPEDAARAADQLAYKVRGPDAPTNFPMTAEQRARLDSITLEQLLAEFRAAGAAGQPFSFGRSRHRGVAWNVTSSKWRAMIQPPNGSQIRLGSFADEDAAASAYDAAAWQLRGSAAKLNFPVKYLTPGQDPPSIETQIPDQAARDRVEAAVRGSKSSTPGGQKVQKRKPAQPDPAQRKKAAGTSLDAISIDICASAGSTANEDDEFFDPESSEGGDESSSEDLGGFPFDSCHNNPLAWLEDSACDEGMQLGGQRDEGQTINPVIFSSIFQRLPALNDFAGVSGMEIVEQVQSSPLVSTLPTAKPPRTPEGSGLQHSIAQQEVQHKAGQRKSGQHEAGQHKAGQCEAGQSEAGQHEAGQRKSGQRKSGQHEAGQRKSGQRKSGQHEAGQHEAAQEADRFLHESLDPLSAAGAPPGRSASAYAYGMSVSSSHTQELPRAINTSNHPQPLQTHPLSDMIFPRASDEDFYMAVADMQLRRMHKQLGLLDEHGNMPEEDRPTHMLALRRQLAAESAAQARVFEGLPPLYSDDGTILQSLARVRHPEDEQLAELLLAQVALAGRGLPPTIQPQDYTWVLDPEPGPGPLRPKGSPAPNDHPAYVLHYLHQISVPLEEEQMTKEQLQEQQALRIAAAREICRKGRGQVQEGGTGSPVTHSGPCRTHTPTLGPASSCMSAETFDGFTQGKMKNRGSERMEQAKVIYEAMQPLLPALYGNRVPPMVWEPATVGIPSSQDLVVLESKTLHAAAKRFTLEAVQQMAAEGVHELSQASHNHDPLLWFCFVRCFFDAWMEQAVLEFARVAQPLYLQRREVSQKVDELIRRREALERRMRDREARQRQAAAAEVPVDNSMPYRITYLDPESHEAQEALAAALAAMAEAEGEWRAAGAAAAALTQHTRE